MSDRSDEERRSEALQYRILERGNEWVLEPAHPEFPRTLVERDAIEDAKRVFPLDDEGRIVIPDPTRDYLDAEPGDVVSLASVTGTHAVAVRDVLEGLRASIRSAVEQVDDGTTNGGDDVLDG